MLDHLSPRSKMNKMHWKSRIYGALSHGHELTENSSQNTSSNKTKERKRILRTKFSSSIKLSFIL